MDEQEKLLQLSSSLGDVLESLVHLVRGEALEVELHLEVPALVSEPRGGVDLLEPPHLPLHRPLGREQRVVVVGVVEGVLHEGQGVVGLQVETVQRALSPLDLVSPRPHTLRHLLFNYN